MRSPIDLFTDAWGIVMGKPKVYIIISAVYVGITAIIILSTGVDPLTLDSDETLTTPELIYFILSGFFGILAYISLTIAIVNNSVTNITSLFVSSLRMFIPYIWVSILVGFMVLLGLVALVIPGIYLMVTFLFATYILLAEDVRGWDALKKSYQYVKGRWFAVFWRLAFLFLPSVAFSLIIGLILMFALVMMPELSVLLNSITSFISMMFNTICFVYIYLIYTDIRNSYATQTITDIQQANP